MMTASLLLFLSFSLCLLLVFAPSVTGVEARGQSYDLQVHAVSRVLLREGDKPTFVVTVNFTATLHPQTQWTHADADGETVYLNSTELTFSGGRGQARATFSITVKLVTLKIGYFDSHFLDIFIRRDVPFNTTQTLNTALSSVSPGYDITYSPGESFQVNAFIPKHIAQDFNGSHYMDDPDSDYDFRLDVCYVDQRSGCVFSSVDGTHHPVTSRFLQSVRTVGEDGARWQLNFTTAHEDIAGYFRFFSLFNHKDFSFDDNDVSQFVIFIWETMDVKIHNASTPGPFPDGYAYMGTTGDYEDCDEGKECSLYCYGYANNITKVTMYKEDTGESPGPMYIHYENSNHFSFHNHFLATGDFTGNYVCKVVAADNTTAQRVIRVY